MAANIEAAQQGGHVLRRTHRNHSISHSQLCRKRVPELSRWLGALDWLGASAPTTHKRTACDINVVMQRQPWQLKLGAGTQEHQRARNACSA